MANAKQDELRLKITALILKDSLRSAGIDLSTGVAISVGDDIFQGSGLFGWCWSSCKEGCKRACKDGCKNTQKE